MRPKRDAKWVLRRNGNTLFSIPYVLFHLEALVFPSLQNKAKHILKTCFMILVTIQGSLNISLGNIFSQIDEELTQKGDENFARQKI